MSYFATILIVELCFYKSVRNWRFFGAYLIKKKFGVVKVILRINLIKSTLGVVHEEKTIMFT